MRYDTLSYLLSPPGPEPKPDLQGDSRTFRVWLDPNQYQQDMAATMQGHEVGLAELFTPQPVCDQCTRIPHSSATTSLKCRHVMIFAGNFLCFFFNNASCVYLKEN